MSVHRLRLTTLGPMIAAILTALAVSSRVAGQSARTSDGPEEPMTIAASCVGRFSRGHSWHLSVNSAGEAELTIIVHSVPKRRRFVVSRRQLAELRKAIDEEHFLDLANEYGETVFDGSTETVTVVAGDRVKSVRLRYLMNGVRGDKAKPREPSRAVRISLMIRGWFDDAEAVDLRPYRRMELDAAKE